MLDVLSTQQATTNQRTFNVVTTFMNMESWLCGNKFNILLYFLLFLIVIMIFCATKGTFCFSSITNAEEKENKGTVICTTGVK